MLHLICRFKVARYQAAFSDPVGFGSVSLGDDIFFFQVSSELFDEYVFNLQFFIVVGQKATHTVDQVLAVECIGVQLVLIAFQRASCGIFGQALGFYLHARIYSVSPVHPFSFYRFHLGHLLPVALLQLAIRTMHGNRLWCLGVAAVSGARDWFRVFFLL